MTDQRVLIVDDEADIRELLEITLQRMALQTCSAASLAEARDLLNAQEFHLCLTDMRLPDGNEVLPVTGIHGPGAQALGALDHLLQEVQAWCDLASRECTATEWQTLLTQRLEALLRIDPADAAANH